MILSEEDDGTIMLKMIVHDLVCYLFRMVQTVPFDGPPEITVRIMYKEKTFQFNGLYYTFTQFSNAQVI